MSSNSSAIASFATAIDVGGEDVADGLPRSNFPIDIVMEVFSSFELPILSLTLDSGIVAFPPCERHFQTTEECHLE